MKLVRTAAALAAALGTVAAQAQSQDWSQFLGSNAVFPTRLADRGLAVDRTTGEIAVQALNDPYGTNDYVHEYTLGPTGALLPWALFGRFGTDTVLEPSGVDAAGGHRVSWIHRGNAFTPTTDHVYGMPNGSTWPSWEFQVSRYDGRIAAIASDAAGGAYVLRVFETTWTGVPGPHTFELIALDAAGAPRWRQPFRTCAIGWVPERLTLDVDPANDTLTVAGACGQPFGRYVFAQRVAASSGAAPLQINLPLVWSEFRDLAFTRAHALVAVFTTNAGLVQVHRLPAGTTLPDPLAVADPSIDAAALHDLAASGADDMLLVADGVRSPVVQRFSPGGPQPAFLLDALAGEHDWRVSASADDRIVALRVEASNGVTSLVARLLDTDGAPQREFKLGGIVAGVGPRAVAPSGGGFVVAIDRRIADGTIGVAVERIVDASETDTIELPWP